MINSGKECRKCGIRIANKYTYCKPCFIDYKKWLRDADHIVLSHEQAGENDFYGYEDKPAINGEKKTRFPKAL